MDATDKGFEAEVRQLVEESKRPASAVKQRAQEPPKEPPLASLFARLCARTIDVMIFLPIFYVGAMAVVAVFGGTLALVGKVPEELQTAVAWLGGGLGIAVLTAAALATVALVIYQWQLIVRRGQTIGKRVLGIKIVCTDGSPVGFVDGVILREWVLTLVGLIPYVGPLVVFANPVPAFGEERRCIHDYLAGTKVVRARFTDKLKLGAALILVPTAAACVTWAVRPDLFAPLMTWLGL